jgi:phosphotransferase system enzyme I (PtsI)
VVLPMVSDVSEVRHARRIIEEERGRLQAEGRETGELKIGAMIEVPAAVLLADKLAREVDFFSLGTNDLVQYLLAVDRGNDEVSAWFRTLHPAVLQSIQRTIGAAGGAGIPAIVCGEMAATPAYALVLVGLGARVLSMTASAMPRVRRTLRRIDASSANEIASLCLDAATADDAEETVRVELGARWPHLFSPENLPAPKREE